MKKLKHIWKYLTSPTYRFWVDFCARQEHLDRNMALIEENLRLQSMWVFTSVDYGFSPISNHRKGKN